jgi:hypothetical protein
VALRSPALAAPGWKISSIKRSSKYRDASAKAHGGSASELSFWGPVKSSSATFDGPNAATPSWDEKLPTIVCTKER